MFTASLHPGAVRTELLRYVGDGIHSIVPILIKLAQPVFMVLFKSSYEGAQTTIHCAVADGLEKYNGFYFRYTYDSNLNLTRNTRFTYRLVY